MLIFIKFFITYKGRLANIEEKIDTLTVVITELKEELKELKEYKKSIEFSQEDHEFCVVSIF
jgi:FtsZ-binding cell division protein ZapB